MAALATIAPIIAITGAVVGAGASVFSAYSTYKQGEAQQQEAYRQAAVDETAGKNEYAAAQRDAKQKRLEGNLIMSRQQAYAAASGGGSGADAPTIAKILTDTGANAETNAQSVMYQGAARRDDYFNQAQARRISGQNNFFGSILSSIGTLAGGVGHLASSTAGYIPTSSPSPIRLGSSIAGGAY